jgi:hypothetical protein
VKLGSSDVMMVLALTRIIAAMMFQTAKMGAMNDTAVAQLMAVVCTEVS